MPVDYVKYRNSPTEQERVADFVRILPKNRAKILDIGARDGYISKVLTEHFEQVVALDLQKPSFDIPRVRCVRGDVTHLDFPDNSFDAVCCLEVLEHIPTALLEQACREIARVARYEVIIGVPFRQDTRIGRTTCRQCKRRNPPYGHVNVFDEDRLQRLFRELRVGSITFVGENNEVTNALSAFLMNFGGNPWGTYEQEEPCLFCGAQLAGPIERSPAERVMSAIAAHLNRVQARFSSPRSQWIHVLFQK